MSIFRRDIFLMSAFRQVIHPFCILQPNTLLLIYYNSTIECDRQKQLHFLNQHRKMSVKRKNYGYFAVLEHVDISINS